MVPISRTNAYAQRASWFIFNLKIKNGVSHAHILMIAMIDTHQTQSSLPYTTHITSYILEQLSIVSTTANESILDPLSKQT